MEEPSAVENIELNALVNCIYEISGYDFRQYARASLYRCVLRELQREQLNHISELIPTILHTPNKLNQFLQKLSINVTQFFRDPKIFLTLVDQVFPVLESFPFIKIWHAGCASGQEVYSLAILLEEAGLLDRTLVYATDFNHSVLAKAKEGTFRQEEIEQSSSQYQQSGGQCQLQDYFHSKYSMAKINHKLQKRITFAHHNLVTDGVFGEMQLIVCQNVLIYFDNQLKQKVIELFNDSLYQGGYLCLGPTESLDFNHHNHSFIPVSTGTHIYKKSVLQESSRNSKPRALQQEALP